MRNLTKLTIVACLLLVCGNSAFAQKLGYINSQELIEAMPERVTALENYETFAKELQNQLEAMGTEYSTKFQEYQSTAATLSASMQELKTRELSELRDRIEQFQYNAQQEAEAKYMELLSPVIDKAQAAIDKVGKANGFAMIFDISTGGTPYIDDTMVTNILSIVKTELGIAN